MSKYVLENNIYQILSLKNMTQAELAQKVGIKREYINRIINHKINPTVPLGLRIAHELNRSVEDIFVISDDNGLNI